MTESILENPELRGPATRRWLSKQPIQERGWVPRFTDAFFGQDPFLYIRWRLRFYFLNQIYIFLIHLAEFFVISKILNVQNLALYFLIFHSTSVIVSAFWGLLEGQRVSLNNAKSRSEKNNIIQDWYTFAWMVFILLSVFFGLLILVLPIAKTPIVFIFIGFLSVRNLFEIIVRTRFSAIFAQSRVYRPVTFLLFLQTIAIIISAMFLYVMELPQLALLNIAMFSLVYVVINWRYINNGYKVHRLSMPKISLKRIRYFRLPRGLEQSTAWNHMAYMLTQRSCSVFIILILYGSSERSLPTVFHLLSPLVTASTNWIQIFYFDYRKFRFSTFQSALNIYYRPLVLTGLLVGVGVSALSILSLQGLMTWHIQALYVALTLFICLRAITSAAFFVKFDQLLLGVSILYFVISVILPSSVLLSSDLGDKSTLLLLSLSQLIALAFILLVKDQIISLKPLSGVVIYSAEQYARYRLRLKGDANEFMGIVDRSLCNPGRFPYFLRGSLKFLSLFLDSKTGRFFMITEKEDSLSEVATSMQGDVSYLRKASDRDWEVFRTSLDGRYGNKRPIQFKSLIYPVPKQAVVKTGSIVSWPISESKLLPDASPMVMPDLEGLTCGDLYVAAKKSAIQGRRVQVGGKKNWRFYLESSTDGDGVITRISLEGEHVP